MKQTLGRLLLVLLAVSGLAFAQENFSGPNAQVDLGGLGEMMNAAGRFHDAVKIMELDKQFQTVEQQAQQDQARANAATGKPGLVKENPLNRTLAMVGAGAGIGVALASMSKDRKTVMIGAIAGGVGGLIIDQLMRHRAEKAVATAANNDGVLVPPGDSLPQGPLKTRTAPSN